MVSRKFMCRKCNLVYVLVVDRYIHPLDRNSHSPPAIGESILYVCVSLSGVGVSHCHLPTSSPPCCVCRCTARDPTTISSPKSKHFTLTLCLSWYVNPSPVIRCSYAASHWVSAARQGKHTILIVLSNFFYSTILQNSLVRVLNAPCRYSGSVDVTRPSSA